MRILHLLSNHEYTGPAEPLLMLIRAQMNIGHEVVLVVDSFRDGDLAKMASSKNLLLENSLMLSVKAGPLLQIRDFIRMKGVWKNAGFDIIHCHKSHEHSLATLARNYRSRTRLVRTLNKGLGRGRLRRAVLERTDGVFTVAQSHANELMSSSQFGQDRLAVLGGIVDGSVFSPGDDGALVRKEAGIPQSAPLAGLVSRIKKGRGHLLLLDAWVKVHSFLPEAHLLISGRGEWARMIADRAKDSVYEATVHVLGYQKNLVRLYRSFDAGVMLAPGNDGTCRGALQSMACEKPMLVSDIGALADIVVHGHTGLQVKNGDLDELADSLIRLLSDKASMVRMGVAARKRILSVYTLDRHFQKVQSLYEQVLASGSK